MSRSFLRSIRRVLQTVGMALVCVALPLASHAASMGLSGAQSSYRVGDTLSLDVSVSSPDKSLNAVSGIIQVPTDLVDIVSISQSSSIVNFWIQSPAFDASAGTVSFEGGILGSGYQGSGGHVLRIRVRTKNAGTAMFTFRSGAVLANDGQGTNILDNRLGNSSFLIRTAATPQAVQTETAIKTPDSSLTPPSGPAVKVPTSASEQTIPATDVPDSTASATQALADPLITPVIIDVSQDIRIGDFFTVLGTTQTPLTHVVVWLESDTGPSMRFHAQSDEYGMFSHASRAHLPPGNFRVSVEAVDAEGRATARSVPVPLHVRRFQFSDILSYLLLGSFTLFGTHHLFKRRRKRWSLFQPAQLDRDMEQRVHRLAEAIHQEMRELETLKRAQHRRKTAR